MSNINNSASQESINSNKINHPSLQEVEDRVLNCREYGGAYCNPAIHKIISDTERLVNRDYNVNPTKIKNDFIQFIPRGAELGYFGADGSYHKY